MSEILKGSEYRKPADPVSIYAQRAVDSNVLGLIKALSILDSLESLGAPSVIIQSSKDNVANRISYIGGMAVLAGLSESEVTKRALILIAEVLADFSKGIYNTGKYLGSLSKEDRPVIENLRHEIESGQLTFVTPESVGKTDELKKQIEDELRSKKEMVKLVNQFCLGDRWFDFGEEIDVSQLKKESDYKEELHVPIMIPIIAGRKLQIQVSEWKEDYFPQVDKQDINGFYGDSSYSPYNALFYYQPNPVPNNRTIKPITYSDVSIVKSGVLGNLRLKNTRNRGTELYLGARFFDKSTPNELRRVLKRELGLDKQAIGNMTSIHVVELITDFLNDNSSGSDVATGGDMRLEDLLTEYRITGLFPGTCKSTSTLASGFYEALGLRARVVRGSVLNPHAGEMYGHQWAEGYLPEAESWGLMDSSLGNRILYPNRRDVYFIENYIYPPQNPLRIKVDVT